jgi:hypothetical protein
MQHIREVLDFGKDQQNTEQLYQKYIIDFVPYQKKALKPSSSSSKRKT